ncbi:MAG TPA: glycoside hydrolase family 5 protein [Chloroflexota bacterium]
MLARFVMVAVLLPATVLGLRAGGSSASGVARPNAATSGYWHTAGDRIVDAAGRTVRIAAVNWFGFDDRYEVPEGLQKRSLDSIASQIKSLGFNAIRLPFSNQAIERDPVVTRHLDANPEMMGLHTLQIMDRVVAAAQRFGLRVILDDARSNAGDGPDLSGLWYTPAYPENAWIHDWRVLATRYRGNPTVIGVDLRNEPHTRGYGPWSIRTYLTQGATWGPYRGVEQPRTDWRLAAERAGRAIQAVNPHLLIIVEGIQQYPDPKQPGGVDSSWWGSMVSPAVTYPVRLPVAHQLVYSPHEYGPFKHSMRYFTKVSTYTSLVSTWQRHWGSLMTARGGTPILLGEFGTCSQARCARDSSRGSQGLWFQYLMQFLKTHPQVGWAFWALDGTDARGRDLKNDLLRADWKTIRQPEVMNALKGVE